ncbi:MAG: sigma-70 family RNA polymerase sigma factor [Planctomycetota bacterium]
MTHPSSDDLTQQGAALRRLAIRLVADPEAAEDVVQDAWVQALERPPREAGAIRSWLQRVVHGRSVDALRAKARRMRVEQPLGEIDPPARSSAEHALDLQITVLEAVRALPEPYRWTIWRRYFADQPPRDIAAADRLPVKTVKTRLHRALSMLREQLDAEHGGQRRAWVAPLATFAMSDAPAVAAAGAATTSATPAGAVAAPTLVLWSLLMKTTALRISAVAALALGALAVSWSLWSASSIPEPAQRADSARLETNLAPASDAATVDIEPPEPRTPLDDENPVAATTGALAVRVLWHDRTPAAGVAIALRPDTAGLPRSVFAQEISDPAGRVLFNELGPGSYGLRSDRDEGGEVAVEAGTTTEHELVLDRGVDVEGVVVHADGSPAPGAGVWLQTYYRDWAGGRLVTRADATGSFHVRSATVGASLGAIAATGSLHAPSTLVDLDLVKIVDHSAEVRLQLGARGGRVEGTVVDAVEGNPIARARIAFGSKPRSLNHLGDRVVEQWGPRAGLSDDQGRFAVDGLAPGEVEYSARRPDGGIARGTVYVAAAETAHLELLMAPAATIHGRVVDSAGAPLEGVAVSAFDQKPGLDFVQLGQVDDDQTFGHVGTLTDDDGAFRLPAVTPGTVHLVVRQPFDPGHRRDRAAGRPYVYETREIAAGADAEWNPVLDEGRTIEGHVLFGDGHPMKGQYISLRDAAGDEAGTLMTGRQGQFRFVCLKEGVYDIYVQVFDKPPDTPSVELTDVVPDRGPVEIRATFNRPEEKKLGKVRGRVLDAGQRLANPKAATVILVTDSNSWYTCSLDDDGSFHFDYVEPGRLRLVVLTNDSPVHEAEPFELGPAEERDVGVVTTSAVTASVNVTIRRGPAASELEPSISLRRDDRARGTQVKPGRDSELEIDNLEPGPYTWKLYCRGGVYRTGKVTLHQDAPAELAIDLNAGASCRFDLQVNSDAELGDVTVVYERGGEEFDRDNYHPDSVLDFRRYHVGATLPLGEWRAVMTTTTGLRAEARFTVESVDQKLTPVLDLK